VGPGAGFQPYGGSLSRPRSWLRSNNEAPAGRDGIRSAPIRMADATNHLVPTRTSAGTHPSGDEVFLSDHGCCIATESTRSRGYGYRYDMSQHRLAVFAVAALVSVLVGGCASHVTSPPIATTPGPTSTIPNVVDKSLSQAVHVLTADGFAPDDSGLAPDEIVTATEPAAGTYSGGSALIHLTVSPPTTTTTKPPTAVVPNVAGDTITTAASAMAAVGFDLHAEAVYSSNVVAYTVPAAGTRAPVGGAIEEYSCAAGSEPSQSASGTWVCNPGNYGAVWGGQ
jgi:hypothetical protein